MISVDKADIKIKRKKMSELDTKHILQKEHLYEQVADLLEQQIINDHEHGERLPSEQQLAEKYQVSRTIIREALKLLKERGLIDSKAGSGSYVTRPEAQNIAEVVYRIIRMDQIDYASVFDVRIILEMESVSRAAQYATDEELQEMERLLELMKDPDITPVTRSGYDFSFHYLIAKASRNPLLALMTEAIGTICEEMIQKAFLLQHSLQDSIMRHSWIMEALKSGDPKAAKQAMLGHLEKSKSNYEKYIQDYPTR